MPALAFEQLFDTAFLAQLEQFSLRIARAQKGWRLGEQFTAARGQGNDFVDFKSYVAGDDLRAIDWNIYRRLGRVFVRVFEERQDMPVYLIVDLSRSMFVERPPRIHAALRAALALAAVALDQHDSVGLFSFSDGMTTQVRSVSGKHNLVPIARRLAASEPLSGRTDLPAALQQFASLRLRRGLAVIVSDFFSDDGLPSVLRGLGMLPHQLLLVQLVKDHDADPELNPDLRGDIMVEDGETATQIHLTVSPEVVDRYRQAYRAFQGELAGFARQRGAGLARIDADRPVLDQLAMLFTAGGRS